MIESEGRVSSPPKIYTIEVERDLLLENFRILLTYANQVIEGEFFILHLGIWINIKNYSVSQGNDTQSYKSGPETSSSKTDSYSVTKSDSTSSNSNGKPTSKNNSETYSENTVQRNNEYKVDAYTSTGSSDEQTIVASRSNSSSDGTNSNWFSGSDQSTTRNSQTVTNYKDGRKDENSNSSYQKWSSESTTDSKGLVSAVSKYSR